MRYKRLSDGVVMDERGFTCVCHNCIPEVDCDRCPIGSDKQASGLSCTEFMRERPVWCADKLGFEPIPECELDERLLHYDDRLDTLDKGLIEAQKWLAERGNHVAQTEGMSQERFEALVTEIREKSLDTLLKKNANYGSVDKLHNFRRGAAILGCTPAQAALGYMTKHLASLTDKIQSNDFSDRDDFLEKIQDSINYLVFIWCCGNEERDKEADNGA